MASSSLKPFLLFFLTFLVPRALSYYRSIKIAIKTRPPPRPLPSEASRALNVLFFSTGLFFLTSFLSFTQSYEANIFELTKSRLHIPTDVLFSRLSLVRTLTPFDEALREKITTPVSRTLYLRFGAHTLTTCPFCSPTDPLSYALHHLPVNNLLPHLVHLLLIGLATSASISGPTAKSLFRNKFILFALALASLDVYLMINFPISISKLHSPTPPRGIYWTSLTLRPIIICVFDMLCACLIYLAATNRLPFLFPASTKGWNIDGQGDQQQLQLRSVYSASVALQTALTKLRACNLARNVVIRDVGGLKRRQDAYWRILVEMEGLTPINATREKRMQESSIWEDEEVMEAVSRATKARDQQGTSMLDIETIRKEAELWVDAVTAGLAAKR